MRVTRRSVVPRGAFSFRNNIHTAATRVLASASFSAVFAGFACSISTTIPGLPFKMRGPSSSSSMCAPFTTTGNPRESHEVPGRLPGKLISFQPRTVCAVAKVRPAIGSRPARDKVRYVLEGTHPQGVYVSGVTNVHAVSNFPLTLFMSVDAVSTFPLDVFHDTDIDLVRLGSVCFYHRHPLRKYSRIIPSVFIISPLDHV